jgi:hypothetical protein
MPPPLRRSPLSRLTRRLARAFALADAIAPHPAALKWQRRAARLRIRLSEMMVRNCGREFASRININPAALMIPAGGKLPRFMDPLNVQLP